MERTDRIVNLLKKYILQDISSEELVELNQWCERHPEYRTLLSELSDQSKLEQTYHQYKEPKIGQSLSYESVWQQIESSSPAISKRKTKQFKKWLSIAASLLVVVSCTWLLGKNHFFQQEQVKVNLSSTKVGNDIVPGTTKAQLTLNTGRKINFSGNVSDMEVDQGKVYYTEGDRRVEFSLLNASVNTLIVPKGGEFKVRLPDGSLVWLNASSSLQFPSQFTGSKREVKLTGEAYFEVQKNEKQPFIVQSRQQELRVLGTSFNVKSYQDDQETTTTLVEGKVAVYTLNKASSSLLLPGEEANIGQNQHFNVHKADLNKALSWQRGEFVFNRTSVYEVMKQIARWYDVEVAYAHGMPEEYFTGQLNRSVDFEVVLRFLKESGINYSMNDRKITIL